MKIGGIAGVTYVIGEAAANSGRCKRAEPVGSPR